jgi:hypothetical protein
MRPPAIWTVRPAALDHSPHTEEDFPENAFAESNGTKESNADEN